MAVAILRQPEGRLLTLTGPGGIGKTRLSQQIAAELQADFEDGIVFVALAPLSDPALTLSTIAQSIGAKDGGAQCLLTNVKEALHDKQLLLILDNFEHVIPAAGLVADLLTASPKLKILVTSRQTLHLYNERELVVPPLRLPSSDKLPALSELEAYEGIALFVQRSRMVKPNFSLTEETASTIVEICQRLDGLPLAIELAAARGKLLPPATLLDRLGNRLKLLTDGASDLPTRQQTIRSTIEWSYRLLNEAEKQLFAALGVFAGGTGLEAIETICQAKVAGQPEIEVLDELASLVGKSLVQQIETKAGEPRFTMLATLREYALERLTENNTVEDLKRVHAEYFLELAEQASEQLRGAQQAEWLDRLETECDNLRAALDWAEEKDLTGLPDPTRLEISARMSTAMAPFWEMRGYLREGRQRLTYWLAAQAKLEKAGIAVSKEALAQVNLNIGRLIYLQGDYQAARPQFEANLRLFGELQDKTNLMITQKYLGDLALRQSEYKIASRFYQESLEIAQEIGNQWESASCLNSLGLVEWFQGQFSAARHHYKHSLEIWQELGDKRTFAMTLSNIGAVAYQQGDYEAAKADNSECLRLWQELGDRWGISHALQHLGLVAYAQDNLELAADLQHQSLTLRREIGDRWGIGRSLANLGLVACQEGALSAARAFFEESLTVRREIGDRWGIADALIGLSHLAWLEKDCASAKKLLQEGLRLASQFSLNLQVARLLEGLVLVVATCGELETAIRFAGAAFALRETLEAVMPSCEQAEYETALLTVQTELGKAAYNKARLEGQAWTLVEAIAQARDGEETSLRADLPRPSLESLTGWAKAGTLPAEESSNRPSPEKGRNGYLAGLTAREVEVLQLVAQGLTNSQVAEKLVMAPCTVNVHLTSIYNKLDVSSRTAAVRYALDHKLI